MTDLRVSRGRDNEKPEAGKREATPSSTLNEKEPPRLVAGITPVHDAIRTPDSETGSATLL